MLTAQIGSGVPVTDPYRPALVTDVPGLHWRDATHQDNRRGAPTVRALVVEVDATDADLAAILAHPSYGAVSILWREDDPNRTMDAADRTALNGRLTALGVPAGRLAEARGNARNRREAEEAVRTFLKRQER